MKRVSEVMANKYKISSQRVYQIWREVHLPIDPKEMVSYPPTDLPLDSKKIVSTNTNSFYGEKMDLHKSSTENTQGKGLHGEELRVFYKKNVKEDEKNKAETARLLATT
ncbi:2677_t:CDS:2 [Funneliformis caledonium]|uniref:2677_t:CDS:1 n=1 Tax=Funneliformis caledonium TaxID=1117310 RepID=A0A9N9HL39_9GLOM|nr:2677_t:CDS:2 [Funneliformis caledonium]